MKKTERPLLTLFLIISAATILVAGVLVKFTHENRNRINSQNHEYLIDATRKMAAGIDSKLDAGFENIRFIAGILSNYQTGMEIDLDQLRSFMKSSVFDFIEFADTEGWDHTVLGTKTYAGDRNYFTQGVQQGKTGLEVVYDSRATHETLLMFYAPVFYKEKIIGAVIGVYQAARKITGLLSSKFFGKDALAYLADPDGRVVASSSQLDTQAVVFIDDLPEGGRRTILPGNGWQIVQYFPEEATEAMVSEANSLGYHLCITILFLYAVILVTTVLYLRNKHSKYTQAMEKALSSAEKSSQAKTTFLNNMSHDIRTPLNAITGFNDMALRELGKDNDKVRSCLIKVSRSSETLLKLISDILEISHIETGKVKLSEDNVDILFSFMGIESMLKEIARESGIGLQFTFGTIEDKFVIYDSSHVTRIFTNLISNAIKFNQYGGWVRVRCEQIGRRDQDHGLYRYTVEDNGIGMSEEFQEHMFEQFTRENNTTASRVQGIGLGLAMCKDLTELMGGTITCTSIKGKGTTFTVTLPYKLQDGRNYSIPEMGNRHIIREFIGKKVLLVEDNELNSEIAASILEEMGFTVTFAKNGSVAVQIMSAAMPGDFDVILMDIQMPVLDGYEATRQIRALGTEISMIPIIAMTANAFEEDRQQAIDCGMNDHIAKPVNPQLMAATIAKYVSGKL